MAPQEVSKCPKTTPKVQRSMTKSIAAKGRSSPATTIKKALTNKKVIAKIPLQMDNTVVEPRKRTNTVPKESSPKPKENKSVPCPGSVTKSARKPAWKRRPKAAHSGVPVPEKMKLLQNRLKDLNDSF